MLEAKLSQFIRHGRLTITLPSGTTLAFGDGSPDAPAVAIRLHGWATPLKLALDLDRYVGEAYMDGDLILEQGSIYDLLMLGMINFEAQPREGRSLPHRLALRAGAAIRQHNTGASARRNVAHHYDISNDLYRVFLDRDMQYSCAYFTEPGQSLDDAQAAKKRHIAAKLLLEPGQRILDIGCGWGGLAITLAQLADVSVIGITLSEAQLGVARQRVAALGLQNRVRFELADYRTLQGTFDRIVSVGMFEHVGTPQYQTYFDTVARLLAPDGVALIHSIGRNGPPARTSGWITRYIFPGGHIPALSEAVRPIEDSGLWLTDFEILRLHYAETLRHWRERFMARRHLLRRQPDDRFVRMWEFYLASSEASFRHGGLMVFQAQLSKALGTVPLTRDYLSEAEQRSLNRQDLRAAE